MQTGEIAAGGDSNMTHENLLSGHLGHMKWDYSTWCTGQKSSKIYGSTVNSAKSVSNTSHVYLNFLEPYNLWWALNLWDHFQEAWSWMSIYWLLWITVANGFRCFPCGQLRHLLITNILIKKIFTWWGGTYLFGVRPRTTIYLTTS